MLQLHALLPTGQTGWVTQGKQKPQASAVLPSDALSYAWPTFETGQALKAQIRFASETPAPNHASVTQFERLKQAQLKSKVPNFKFDPFQSRSMNFLAEGKSVMVSAPTSSGKTLVAEYMIEKAINPQFWENPAEPPTRRKVFYTTPRKAISNEKYRDFCAQYGAQNVGLMTGDITLNPQAPIVLMTTEVLRNILYEEPQKMAEVGSVVFDECHFVNDRERGPVWEESMIHMPKEVQQLHLSATVGNAPQYVSWMNTLSTTQTELVYEDKRPVPLHYLFFNPKSKAIEPLFDRNGKVRGNFHEAFRGENKGYKPYELARAMQRYKNQTGTDLGPMVATAFSKRLCNEYFEDMIGGLSMRKGKSKGSSSESKRLQKLRELIAEQTLVDPYLSALNPDLIKGLQHGFGIHHAGMTYAERALVEKAQKAGLLDMVWATDTLGAGINTSQRTAVMTQFNKYNGEDFEEITASDFHQIIGRAGRRGIFEPGYAIIVPPRNADATVKNQILDLIHAGPEHIESKFKPTPTMVLNLLKTHTVEDARNVMKKSFAAFQSGDPKQFNRAFNNTVQLLETLSLLEPGNANVRKLSPLGCDLSKVPDSTFIAMYTLLKGMYGQTTSPGLKEVTQLKDWELVQLLSATLNERGENPHPSKNNSFQFMTVAHAFTQASQEKAVEAEALGINNQTPLNFNFSDLVTQWMMTGNWMETRDKVENQGFYIGDFMNVVRRTANLLDKLSEMSSLPQAFKAKVISAREKLLQAPIKESIQSTN